MNIIRGNFAATDNLVCGTNVCVDSVEPDLANRVMNLVPTERYSFIFRGNAQALDHALTSSALEPFVSGTHFGRGNADAAVDLINDAATALRASDHDGLVLYISNDDDADGVSDDVDLCLGTAIPELVPQQGHLGNNRWALTDERRPNGIRSGAATEWLEFQFHHRRYRRLLLRANHRGTRPWRGSRQERLQHGLNTRLDRYRAVLIRPKVGRGNP